MDTDDKLTDEGMAGEPSGKAALVKVAWWKKPVVILIGIVLFSGFAISVLMGLGIILPKRPHYQSYCMDEMGRVNSAIMNYEAATGSFPDSIDSLVPEYLRVMPFCPNEGSYYLEPSAIGYPPQIHCSVHGTPGNYIIPPSNKWHRLNQWLKKWIWNKEAMLIIISSILCMAYVIFLWKKKPFRKEG
jgi:hypothetical protein